MNAENVECPACDWRGHPAALYQTEAGLVCPNCIDEGGHSRCVPVWHHPPLLSATVQCPDCKHVIELHNLEVAWGEGYCPKCDTYTIKLPPEPEPAPPPLSALRLTAAPTSTPNDGLANDRLCAAIAAVLTRDDLTPEARTLVEGALRAQRGEAAL